MLISKDSSQPNILYQIWTEPVIGSYYAIGCDPAGSADTGANTAVRVWCDKPRQLVAEAVGNASEEVWAAEIDKLGRFYTPSYPAWIAIEIFTYGRIMLSILQTGNELYNVKQYPHIYHEPSVADLKSGIHRPSGVAGWWAGGGATRNKRSGYLFPAAQEALQFARDHIGTIPDTAGIMEYFNTKWIDGRPDPAPGEKIDRVIADGLAWLVFKQNIFSGMYPEEQQPQQKPYDWYIENNQIMFNPLGEPFKRQKKGRWFK